MSQIPHKTRTSDPIHSLFPHKCEQQPGLKENQDSKVTLLQLEALEYQAWRNPGSQEGKG